MRKLKEKILFLSSQSQIERHLEMSSNVSYSMYATSKMPSYRKLLAIAVLGFVSSSFLPCTLGYSTLPRISSNAGSIGLKSSSANTEQIKEGNGKCRRAFLTVGASLLSSLTLCSSVTEAANAFENRLDNKYADVIPQTGTQPTDLGHLERASKTKGSYTGLKQCGNSPNCWCSSAPFADAPARFIPSWGGKSIEDLKQVIDTYQVGQNGIDGGGFKIIEYDEKGKYMYVQFQSYKAGYIDDFECWFNPQSQKFDVRSSSRLGMSDLGVNAKRLEYIGGRLEMEFGWTLERRKNGSLV